jgi:hypothetical protein
MTRRIVITGATGLIGRAICTRLMRRGDQLVIFSRDPQSARTTIPGAAQYVAWRPEETGPWAAAIDSADAVVHLAGASIAGKRWTPEYKREILESREIGTRGIVNAIAAAASPPKVLVSASGVDYYGPRDDTPIDESAPAGTGFLSQVCIAWEQAALRAAPLGVRTSVIRTGIVLDRHEGALAQLILPFSLGLGGPILPGDQWWSWIHLDDLVALYMLALDDVRASGAFNGAAPEPVRNREFAATLGRVLRRPAILPLPLFPLTILLGEMAKPLLVEKQRAIPRKALELGFTFRYPTLEPALRATLT